MHKSDINPAKKHIQYTDFPGLNNPIEVRDVYLFAWYNTEYGVHSVAYSMYVQSTPFSGNQVQTVGKTAIER